MNHLNKQQMAELLAATPHELRQSTANSDVAALQNHASECATCAAELARMRESLDLFRDASTAYADAHMKRIPAWQPPARRTFVLQPVYWAAAAAALLVAGIIPLQMATHHSPQQPVQAPLTATGQPNTPAESDEAFLESVNRELSESVPTPMAALADPTGSSTQASQNSTQRTN